MTLKKEYYEIERKYKAQLHDEISEKVKTIEEMIGNGLIPKHAIDVFLYSTENFRESVVADDSGKLVVVAECYGYGTENHGAFSVSDYPETINGCEGVLKDLNYFICKHEFKK